MSNETAAKNVKKGHVIKPRAPEAPEAAAGATTIGPQQFAEMMAFMQKMNMQPQAIPKAEAEKKAETAAYRIPMGLEFFREAYEAAPTPETKEKVCFLLDQLGRPDWADELRGHPWESGIVSSVRLIGAKNIKMRHVVYGIVLAGVLILVTDVVCLSLGWDSPFPVLPVGRR